MPRKYSNKCYKNIHNGLTKIYKREHKSWRGILHRCLDKKCKAWHNYGGRGITICDKWRYSFVAFMQDMGPKPTPKHTIERINNNGNYEPDNCKWATFKEQHRNKRSNTVLTYKGESKCMQEWSEITGICVNTILYRLGKGWSVDKVLSTNPKDYDANRPAKMHTHKGETKSLVQWAEEENISVQCIWQRIKMGWTLDQAIFRGPRTCVKKNIKIEVDGQIRTVKHFAKKFNIPYDELLRRLNEGWSPEKALTTPV